MRKLSEGTFLLVLFVCGSVRALEPSSFKKAPFELRPGQAAEMQIVWKSKVLATIPAPNHGNNKLWKEGDTYLFFSAGGDMFPNSVWLVTASKATRWGKNLKIASFNKQSAKKMKVQLWNGCFHPQLQFSISVKDLLTNENGPEVIPFPEPTKTEARFEQSTSGYTDLEKTKSIPISKGTLFQLLNYRPGSDLTEAQIKHSNIKARIYLDDATRMITSLIRSCGA